MPRRPDSPYTDERDMPAPDGFAGAGEVGWLAQNDGQTVYSAGPHYPPREDLDE